MASDTKNARMRLARRIARELRQRIATGLYRPHSYLPSERQLAGEFSTSRSTISAALDLLRDERLVIQASGRGTRVLPPMERLSRQIIGVVHRLADVATHQPGPEGIRMLGGVQEAFSRLAYPYELVPIATCSTATEALQETYGALLFIETLGCEEQILELEARKFPVVVANLEIDLEVSATWVDHRKTTRSGVNLLASMGHRRIAYLGRSPASKFYGKARQGYLDGLAETGMPMRPELLADLDAGADSLDAYFATAELLKAPEPPTAIVAARDRLAHGACRAVTEAGLVVGRDVSVIGFDDVTWPREDPFLTTFREPCHEMGVVAAEMLVDQIVSGWRPPEQRELEAPLVMRRSVGPAVEPGEPFARAQKGGPQAATRRP